MTIKTPPVLVRRWVAALLLWPAIARAADTVSDTNVAWFAEHYTKFEYKIPMRDGVRLLTRVYIPKDDSQPWPIMLTRTCYGLKPYGVDNPAEPRGSFLTLAKDRFILATQDVRGRYGSEGEFVHVRPYNPNKGPKDADESTDAYDTIDWLVKNVPGNNGNVGVFGISYPGFYTSMAMIDSHPALKAASPQAPISDWFIGDDLHHNGAWFLSQNFNYFFTFEQKVEDPLHQETRSFNFNTPDGYEFYLRMGPLRNSDTLLMKGRSPSWTEFLEHTTYDDFWQARNIRPHLKNIHCAVMTVGGWYDAEDLFGALETYRWSERQNPGITNMLVMGPWTHGAWGREEGQKLGPVDFHAKTSEYYREHIELPFFRRFLKGDTNFDLAEARIFETGTDRWRKYDAWPPKQTVERTLYLLPGKALGFERSAGNDAFDEFVSDPTKPVPYTMELSDDYPRAFPVEDQRFAASRTDVLTYEMAPLEEDLTIAGPIKVTLHVSTTGTDADWVVKLIDRYAGDAHDKMGAYQRLVRADVFRGKFRHSFEKPEPFEPGKIEKIEFTMPDICHAFRKGHRVMVQVQSTWFPLVDRNPQTFVDISTAKPEDFKKATQRIYLGGNTASALSFQVVAPVTQGR